VSLMENDNRSQAQKEPDNAAAAAAAAAAGTSTHRARKRKQRRGGQESSERGQSTGPSRQRQRGSFTSVVGFLAVVWLLREARRWDRNRRERRRSEAVSDDQASANVSSASQDVSAAYPSDSSELLATSSESLSGSAGQPRPSWRETIALQSDALVGERRPSVPESDASTAGKELVPETFPERSTGLQVDASGSALRHSAAVENESQDTGFGSQGKEETWESTSKSRLVSVIESEQQSISLLRQGDGDASVTLTEVEQRSMALEWTKHGTSSSLDESTRASNLLSASLLSSSAWQEPPAANVSAGRDAALEASRERVIVTNEFNEPLRVVTRAEMRRENLWHRATYVLVLNPERDRIYIQKRTPTKDIHPGMYDAAAGGVVQAGESYEESARRELAEELGLDLALEPVGPIRYESDLTRVFGQVYVAIFDPFEEPRQRIRPQAEEVEFVELVSIDDVMSQSGGRIFTEDTLIALRTFIEKQEANNSSKMIAAASETSESRLPANAESTVRHEANDGESVHSSENRTWSSSPDPSGNVTSASTTESPHASVGDTANPLRLPDISVNRSTSPPIESFINDLDSTTFEESALRQRMASHQ
jgi:8-oxo-dGTP pyrophosphatase MutT (NUDIX family)